VSPSVRRLLAACLPAAALVVAPLVTPALGAAPAGAVAAAVPDACPRTTAAEAVREADAVFTGEVSDAARQAGSAQDPVFAHEVRVERVYKGSVTTETVPVLTRPPTRRGAGLGALEEGQTYLFLVRAATETFVAGGCGGTSLASADLVTRIEQLLGDGRSPTPPEVPQAHLESVADSEPADFTRTAAPGLALVLVGLLGLVVVRRLGRRA
jgi:hypothetical protein